jgi:Sec-independent protein secretion pathway component TatC
VTQVLLAGPMVILYLLGVGVAYLFGPARRATEDAGEASQPAPR